MKLSSFFSRGVLVATLAWGLAGCGDSNRAPGAGGGLDKTPIPGKCSIPAEGCPCTTDLSVECGETVERDEDTLTCRKGERSCIDGSWSSCAGTKTTQIYSPPPTAPGVGIQALATDAESCEDECDPYCQTLADTPDESIMVGSGLTVDDDGIELLKGANCTDIAVTPAMSTLTITQINTDGTVVPDTVSLEPDCLMGMLNIDPSWSVMETDRAAINQDGDVRVFSAIASTLHVTAATQTDSAAATVDVKVDVNDLTALPPATAAATATAFTMPGTLADPGKTLYPYKDTVFPLDLNSPVVQWQTGGTNANEVQIALRYPRLSTGMPITFSYSKIHATEPTGGPLETTGAPAWQIPQEVWNAFGRSAAGQVGEIVIQRRTAATLYNEMIIPVRFATEPLRGTVYYTQYKRKLRDTNAATNICGSSQPDIPDTFNALSPGTTICPVGNCTHIEASGASTTRAIDMSDSAATNLDPFGGNGGCPVCHSVSANGNVYVAGSRFLAKSYSGTNAGFVNNITANASGAATFSLRGEAPNYNQLRNVTDWDSRGFGYAPLTPNGELALQGFYTWGNTADPVVADNLQLAQPRLDGGQLTPMFLVPTDNIGSTVQYATTAALSPPSTTLTGNVLTSSTPTQTLKTIDNACVGIGNSVLLKNEANATYNGVYVVNSTGGCKYTSATTPTSVSSTNGGNVQANAVDGNAGTRWESAQGVDPQSIFVNLTAVKPIRRVRIDWENASARDYLVQVSDTGTTWTTVATMTNMATGDHRIDNHCLNTSGQYVRLWMTARTTGWGYSIYEMEVSGDEAACNAPFTSSSYQMTRRVDADDAPGNAAANTDLGTITGNYEVRVTRGNANYGHVFRLDSATAPTVNADPLTFVDTGATPMTWPMMAPTISPDGTKLAYVTGDQDVIGADSTAWRKGITIADLSIANRTVTNKRRVLNNWVAGNGGNSIKWPFFEGDSRSLIFVESSTTNFCSSTDPGNDVGRACKDSTYGGMAPTSRGYWPGRLTSIDSAAGNTAAIAATKFELSKANDAEDAADADKAYQPTVLKDAIGGYRWVIFTSPRSYGNQINQIGTHFSCGATMLWVAAVDNATATATDRSHPGFLLPGQTMAKIVNPEHYVNERGYLVPSPCKGDGVECSTNSECCNMKCAVDTVPMSGAPTRVCRAANYCAAMGGACLSASDCCGTATCVDQQCVPPPIYDSPATYTREYEAECPAGFHPLWGLFLFHQTSEGNSHIGYSAKTAPEKADLDMAQSVALLDSSADNLNMTPASVNVGDKLLAATPPVSANLSWLRVSMTLYPSGGGAYTPILHDWEQRYTCVPAE